MNDQSLFPQHILKALSFDPPGAWMPPLPEGTIRLSAGYPSPNVVPTDAIAHAALHLLQSEQDLPLHYLGSRATQELSRWITSRLEARHMAQSPSGLLVTSGGCQAIDLVARALLDEDSVVFVEAPTYMEALEIFRNYTSHIYAIPIDNQGLQVELLEEALRGLTEHPTSSNATPKMLYTIPTFQNPTGTTMSVERRAKVLELARTFGFVVVEDDAYGELGFHEVPPTLKSMDQHNTVLHIGSLSKVVAPGLRIGWAYGPKQIIEAMDVLKKDLGHPFSEALTSTYLSQIDFEARVAELRVFYQAQWQAMNELLLRHMPESVTWIDPSGGYFVWLTVPGVDTGDMLQSALQNGVAYVPGRYFYTNPTDGHNELRLSFSYLPARELELGVSRLAKTIRDRLK